MKRGKNQQDATIRCLLLISISTCFGHHYGHLQKNKDPVTAFGVLFIINFSPKCFGHHYAHLQENKYPVTVLDVVGSGCGVLRCRMRAVLASYNVAPHNRYQAQPAEPEQYTKCSNGVFVLLKMGIMMPETC
jgi:hypothetical protein